MTEATESKSGFSINKLPSYSDSELRAQLAEYTERDGKLSTVQRAVLDQPDPPAVPGRSELDEVKASMAHNQRTLNISRGVDSLRETLGKNIIAIQIEMMVRQL